VDATVNYIDDAYEISTSYGLRKEQIFISTNSPDTDLIFEAWEKIKNKPSILDTNPHRIIHIGRLVKWKKTDQIIQALKILITDFPDIELVIVGSGKEEKNLKLLAKKLSIESHVKFVGGVYENEELGEYLLASSLYVLAGMGGLSINQAMAFAKPVICSIADGTEKRLVRDGYNGYYFKPDDIADLAEKIKILLQNPKMIEEFGENSLQIIKNEVNVHTVIKGYVDAFNYVCKENSIKYYQ
jgi:glycosyltransferase involved in cell wall biosynthesis